MLLLTESLITFKGEFVIFAAKFKDDSLLLKEILLSHNGEFISIKGWKNNCRNVVFNGRIVIEPCYPQEINGRFVNIKGEFVMIWKIW